MKKLMLWLAFSGFSAGTVFAQTPATTSQKVKSEEVKKQPAVQPVTKSSSHESSAMLKKEGAPEKHFTKNKHVRKDGTSDKRLKGNKEVVAPAPAVK